MQMQQTLKPSVIWLGLINILGYGIKATPALLAVATTWHMPCAISSHCIQGVYSLFFFNKNFTVIDIRTHSLAILIVRQSHRPRYGQI